MTAVEFLMKNITLYVSNEDEYTFNKLFEIALKMEKEQIGYSKEDIIKIVEKSIEKFKTNNP